MSQENNTGRAGKVWADARNRNVFWFRIGIRDIWYLLALVHRQSAVILERLGVAAIEKEERNIEAHLERLRSIKRRLIEAGDTEEHPMPDGWAASFRIQLLGKKDKDGSDGFVYYDHQSAAIIREELGLTVPPAQQRARDARQQQQPVVAQNWGAPFGFSAPRQPDVSQEDLRQVLPEVQASSASNMENEMVQTLARAQAMQSTLEAVMQELLTKVSNLGK